MRLEDAPAGVFWINTAHYPEPVRAFRDGNGLVAFAPFRHSWVGVNLGNSVRSKLHDLGYVTEGLRRHRTMNPQSLNLVEQSVDATPLPMRDGFTDPALRRHVMVRLSGRLAERVGTTGPVLMVLRSGSFTNLLVGDGITLPRGHRIDTSTTVGQDLVPLARTLGVSADVRHFCCGSEYNDQWEVVADSVTEADVTYPTRPQDLKPGDWFTWGGGAFWAHCSHVTETEASYDLVCYRNDRTPTASATQVQIYSITQAFDANPTGYPQGVVDWLAEQPPVQPPEPMDLHQQDVATIGRILMDEAQRRWWCSEYDTIIERINREISTPLPRRNQVYRLVYTVPTEQVVTRQFTTPPTEEQARVFLPAGATLVRVEPGEADFS